MFNFESMSEKKIYDIIICGGGITGLLLAKKLTDDIYFKNHKIALIEKEDKNKNDRTISFWEEGKGEWDSIICGSWENAFFISDEYQSSLKLTPYTYKTIRGIDFYNYFKRELCKKNNFKLIKDNILNIKSDYDFSYVKTLTEEYRAPRVFSSIPNLGYKNQTSIPVLQQHFIGWFVKTENSIFDPNKLIFMDFSVPQKGSTRFMYILPFNKNFALVEYTLFSKKTLKKEEYEYNIKQYLEDKNAGEFEVVEKEAGSIPMTGYNFSKHNKSTLLHIGTSGGWTKASTGFTFKKSINKIEHLIQYLKSNKSLDNFDNKTKFDFYDLLFLDVLYHHNDKGKTLFTGMFKKNKPQRIFRFLDEKSSFSEDLLLMLSFPIGKFVRALIKNISIS
jgi:lycopene beta-cyclase